ncbi:hypothetical protein LJC07_04780 [Christensenellaceae bacterium OttesenSCG-928-L17]|nr:hypothetical protein [Christensenellaceae bacterium OttesenSCG-928-L17]
MVKKSNKNLATVLISLFALIAIGCGIFFVVSNLSSREGESSITNEDIINEAKKSQEAGIVQQIKSLANIYKAKHGSYPSALSDFWDRPNALEDLKYSSTNDGFTITYHSEATGKTIVVHND